MTDESLREVEEQFEGIWVRPGQLADFAEKLRTSELAVEQIDSLLDRVPQLQSGTTGDACVRLNGILNRARERTIRVGADETRAQRDESRERILFISCGQYSKQEKQLGRDIVQLVREETTFTPYFAEDISNLDGLTRSIFSKLDEAVGLICVMHNRGRIDTPDNHTITRASVWIEQELAIAAFLKQILGRNIEVLAFCEKGVGREGLREYLHLNPIEFERSDQVLSKLKEKLSSLDSVAPSGPTFGDCIEIRVLIPIDHPRVRAVVDELQTRGAACVWRYTDELVGTGEWTFVEIERNRVITYAHRNQGDRDRPPEYLVYQATEDN